MKYRDALKRAQHQCRVQLNALRARETARETVTSPPPAALLHVCARPCGEVHDVPARSAQ